MFLFIGGTQNILFEEVISIHDYKSFLKGENKYLLDNAKTNNRLVFVAYQEETKSVVVAKKAIFLSPISVDTLKKRFDLGDAYYTKENIL